MSRSVRILAIVLAVSLAINIFVVGVWAGRAWQRGPGRGPHERMLERGREVEGGGFGKLRWLSREQRREIVPRFKALRAARRDAEAVLREQSFDRARFEQALERVRNETLQMQTELHRLLAGTAAGMSPEQRKELARFNWEHGGGERFGEGRRWRERRGGERERGVEREAPAHPADAQPSAP
jgi:uncharacterized membrane protein